MKHEALCVQLFTSLHVALLLDYSYSLFVILIILLRIKLFGFNVFFIFIDVFEELRRFGVTLCVK